MTNFEKWLCRNGLDRFFVYADCVEKYAFCSKADDVIVSLNTIKTLKYEIYKAYRHERIDRELLKYNRRNIKN